MLDSIILGLYFIIVIFITKLTSAKNLKEYLFVNRKYSLTTLTAAMFASAVGGSSIIAVSDKFYEYGVSFFLMLSGNYLSQIIIALFIITKMKKWIGCLTPADIISDIFSPKLRLLCGLSTAFVSAGFVAIQFYACGQVLYFILGVKIEYIIIACAIIGSIYGAMMGLNSVMRTEVFQSCIIFIGIILVAKIGVNNIGGISEFIKKLPSEKVNFDFFNKDGINFFLSATLVGFNPSFLQRVFVAKDIGQARDATLLYNLLVVVLFVILGIIGLVAFVYNPNLETSVIPYLYGEILPKGIKGLVVAALLSAIMSTANSDLNIASVSLYKDVLNERKYDNNPQIIKALTFALGIISTIIAISFTGILEILFFFVNFWAITFMFPLIFGILSIKIHYKQLYVVIILSIILMTMYELFVFDKLINSNIIGSALNIIIYLMFYCYNKWRNCDAN